MFHPGMYLGDKYLDGEIKIHDKKSYIKTIKKYSFNRASP